jgi:hypothetical protein
LGIEKPATGEQSGTWGETVNLNYDMFDQAINGIVSVTLSTAGSSGSPNTLPITDGAVSNGRNKFIEFVDGGDLGATAYVQLTPNDAEKIVHIRNSLSGSRTLILFQGTYNASNDFEVPNGKDVLVKFSGTGTGATVTDVFVDFKATGVDVTTLKLNGVDVTATAAELNILDGVTATTAELNILDGVTATAAELNILDGVTATTAELNFVDGVTSAIQTQLNGKQETLVSGTNLKTVGGNSLLGSGDVSLPSSMVYPGAGVPVSTGSAWDTSKTAPTGELVGTTDTQTLTNKTLSAPTVSGTFTLPGLWTLVVNGGHLEFRYNNVAVFEIQTTGATIQSGHATWNGTP